MGEPDVKKAKSNAELQQFDEVFPDLLNDLEENLISNPEIKDAIKWFRQVNEYNVPHGKKNRGVSVVTSFKLLTDKCKHTESNLRKARILGWCVEWLQAYFLVADDIMDASVTRRGQPCWYKKENVGLTAINDSFFLEAAVYVVLKKHFKNEPCYVNIMELFHEITLNTIIGQNLDLTTAALDGSIDFIKYTEDRYMAIVKWKTAFYSFYLPVALAMYMAGITDEQAHENAKTILLHMGCYFQVQDDYLDCYGDPEVIGKIGTDIEDNKCGWLIVQALKKANKQQLQVLKDNYGQNDAAKVAEIKSLYKELDLESVYAKYEEESYEDLIKLINKFSGNLPKEVFLTFALKIYKRQK
ncbi:farnesyl pyrophosphate synthase-like [Liolophura sinensis]|uniref:farnesyl pyrophosphate synthase-like n=1 Tax=Liolophura sinensis TaxID=3198878 RepID=UPI0031589DBC